jgi:hypothetical protein
VGLSFTVQAMVAATVMAAGDGGGGAAAAVSGTALARGEGTGGCCGSVSDCSAESAGVSFVGVTFGFGVGARWGIGAWQLWRRG